jgi:hypothetical protein
VELTDPKVIEALMNAVARRKQARHSRKAEFVENTSERRTRCSCGNCATCSDNARWEAIFNAKFADPDYYKARPLRSGSSLNFVRPQGRGSTGRSIER